jgi:hypothetical protein
MPSMVKGPIFTTTAVLTKNEIAEAIHANYSSEKGISLFKGLWEIQLYGIADPFSHLDRIPAEGKMCGHRSKYIPAVKGVADMRQEILGFSKMNDFRIFLGMDNRPKQSIVRSDEEMILCLNQDRPSLGPNARVNNRHMNRSMGKKATGIPENSRGIQYITRFYLVGDIDDLGPGIDGKDNALHYPYVRILKVEIGSQGNYP